MAFKCPKCSRELYNRRKPTCSFCGSPIPDSIRMSANQIAKIERLKQDEARQHREFMERQFPTSAGGAERFWIPDAGSF